LPDDQTAPAWKPAFNPWLVGSVVAIAAFMEILDINIANVALPHISGNLGASEDEGTWVLTTYVVANVIVLPITRWVTSVMGRKRFFMICIAIFTASSLLCGMAPSLPVLLLARVLQGAGGGGLQPMSLAIMADSFPLKKRGMAFGLHGLAAMMAPSLGPTIGGWITDSYSWRWVFLMNLPIGLILLALVYKFVEDPPFLRRFKLSEVRLDYIGFTLLAIGVAALQIVLDKGQEDDWFASRFITALVVISLPCLSALVVWEWRQKQPLIDVRLFESVNFSIASAMMFMVGAVIFSVTVLMPQFLQILVGYTARQAGLVVSVGAVLMLVTMPTVGALASEVPAKYLIAAGWVASAAGLFLTTRLLSLEISFGIAAEIMLLQFAPLGFIIISANIASYIGVPRDKSDSVSGMTTFMRNIGSSFGASVVITILARREQFHIARLTERLSPGSPALTMAFQALASRVSGSSGTQITGLALIYRELIAQASCLSYLDTYIVLGAGAAAMFLLSFLLKSNDPKHTEVNAGH
jgi:DHA2 family multidrug resistance protein